MDKQDQFFTRAERLIERLETLLPPAAGHVAWNCSPALRWRRRQDRGYLEPVGHPHRIRLSDLQNIDHQKSEIERNTRQFLAGLPANNALLWGSRGTGKSSLIKALLTEYAGRGLRVIEIEPRHLVDLPDIVDLVYERPERFILFSDDLSFEAADPGYKALKAVLDGSLAGVADNVLVYATSNRRHLLPEYMSENQQAQLIAGEIHHGEAVEEKISLSERFGLCLSFYPFIQEQYLDICFSWLKALGIAAQDSEVVRREALRYALERGSRSGRVARQFACDWAGKTGLSAGD